MIELFLWAPQELWWRAMQLRVVLKSCEKAINVRLGWQGLPTIVSADRASQFAGREVEEEEEEDDDDDEEEIKKEEPKKKGAADV